MKFLGGAPRLSDLTNGVLVAGTVPFPRFERDFQEAENAGLVTLLVGDTALNSVVITGALVGDRVLVFARMSALKGATLGDTSHSIVRTAGPGDVNLMLGGNVFFANFPNHPAVTRWTGTLHLVADVITAGDITLTQRGSSAGSNSVTSAGLAAIAAWLIPGL